MTKFFIVFIILLCPVVIIAQQDSMISTPTIWLKAESVNDSLQIWTDLSGNGYDVQLPAQGMFSDSRMNFNSCLSIDSLQNALHINYQTKTTAEVTVFAIYKASASKDAFGLWTIQMDSASGISLSTQTVKDVRGEITEYSDTTEAVSLINMFKNKWINRPVDTLFSGINILGNDTLPFKGDFAEFIYYDNSLSYRELARVYTYLAIKYGISIYRMNYINSSDEIIWDFEDNSEFSNEVAGLGCDTILGINQKQSSAMGGDAALTVYTGELKDMNIENTGIIAHKDFLIWSDNGLNLGFETNDTLGEDFHNNVSARKWIMTRSGSTAGNINTNIIINAPGLNDSVFLTLLINREKDFSFPVYNTEVFYPDNIDTLGNYYFSNIYWDTDSSGSDAFAFQYFNPADLNMAESNHNQSGNENNSDNEESGILMYDDNGINNPAGDTNTAPSDNNEGIASDANTGISSFNIYPNPSLGEFSIDAILENTSGLQLTITDANAKVVQLIKLDGSSIYSTKVNIPVKGCYLIKAETSKESKTVKVIVQ